MQINTKKRLRAEGGALPSGEPPLFKWASEQREIEFERPPTFAVAKLSQHFGLSIPAARVIAEWVGLPAEAPYV